MTTLRSALLFSAIAFAGPALAVAQAPQPPAHDHNRPPNGKPLASPAATATATLNGKPVTIKYNAPSMRGREIFGGLVPYDKVWRTGANPATTFITETPLKIGTLEVPAGTYTLYTLPEAAGTPWQLIINRETGQWGLEYKPDMDLGRTPMMAKPVSSPQEVMSISFENVHGKHAELHVRWANVDESVPVEAK